MSKKTFESLTKKKTKILSDKGLREELKRKTKGMMNTWSDSKLFFKKMKFDQSGGIGTGIEKHLKTSPINWKESNRNWADSRVLA